MTLSDHVDTHAWRRIIETRYGDGSTLRVEVPGWPSTRRDSYRASLHGTKDEWTIEAESEEEVLALAMERLVFG